MVGGRLGLRELDDELLSSEPRHRSWRVRQSRRDKVRIVSAFVECDEHSTFFDSHGRRDIQEISEDSLCLSPAVFATNALGHKPVERTRHEGDLQVEVDLKADHGREGVQMKELDGFGDSILDQHSLSVPRDEGLAANFEVVGEQNGRLFVTEINDADLAQFAAIFLQLNALIQDFGSAESAG